MGKRCAVSGCFTGDPEEIKKRKLLQEKPVYLFGVPKVAAEAWSTAIGVTTPLTQNVVCRYHFAAEDIITHFVHSVPDETVVSIERERYLLRKDACPVAGAIRSMPQPPEILGQ
ncbi:uncharacterized protein LOC112495302 [Cephus cinctus]|uniref:Uncharacterized protein LOC112495302 n=1 Tax=Cephus cinctus TaxID=211228 RepID=A0AAJ7RTY3_CEPCN|nr:uncharacterized protein LOC112495302 [Cephus cinctus]